MAADVGAFQGRMPEAERAGVVGQSQRAAVASKQPHLTTGRTLCPMDEPEDGAGLKLCAHGIRGREEDSVRLHVERPATPPRCAGAQRAHSRSAVGLADQNASENACGTAHSVRFRSRVSPARMAE